LNTKNKDIFISFSKKEKLCVVSEVFLYAMIAIAATLLILASFKVPLGPLNALRETGQLTGMITGFTAAGVAFTLALVDALSYYLYKRKIRKAIQDKQIQSSLPPTKPDSSTFTSLEASRPPSTMTYELPFPLSKYRYYPENERLGACAFATQKDSSEVYLTSKALAQKAYVREKLLTHRNEHPFYEQFENAVKETESALYAMSTDDIESPNFAALEHEASYYEKKYQIPILIADLSSLPHVLENLKAEFTSPCYVGIIFGISIKNKPYSHVTPLIFYFPGSRDLSKVECMIMDAANSDLEGDCIDSEMIENYGISQKNIYEVKHIRQADKFSCRVGALVMLRNALLWLRYHEQTGFQGVLPFCEREGNTLTTLPSGWDYTEQLPNKNSKNDIAVRRAYSKRPDKKDLGPEDAKEAEKRQRTKKHFDIEISFNPPVAFNCQDFPDGITFDQRLKTLKCSGELEVNSYLWRKGLEMKARIESRQTSFADLRHFPNHTVTQEDFVLLDDKIDYQFESGSEIVDKPFFRHLVENQDDPFFEQLANKMKEIPRPARVEAQVDLEPIITLSSPVLELEARRYEQKYGIHILISETQQLNQLIEKLNETIKHPTFIGIILMQNIRSLKHVTPSLFYFPGTKNLRDIECMDLDSVNDTVISRRMIKKIGLDKTKYIRTSHTRQVDHYSCRIGALVLLRNALLWLRFHNAKGFALALSLCKKETIEDEEVITALPHGWDYTEQISIRTDNPKPDYAVRKFYSKQKTTIVTAEEARKSKYSNKRFHVTISYPYELSLEAPQGVKIEKKDTQLTGHGWKPGSSISYTVAYPVNDYLFKKAFKIRDRYLSRPSGE
jgi:hypothetical protein